MTMGLVSLYPDKQRVDTNKSGTDFFILLQSVIGEKVHSFSSARAALVFGLRAMELSRLDEILVPPYLSHCVLSALSRVVFPTLTPTRQTRAILVLHQFGFPQRMDFIESVAAKNGWSVINNCAHTILSEHKTKSIADWGDLTVFSLAKIFPCLLGGAMISRHPKVDEKLAVEYSKLTSMHSKWANKARAVLEQAHAGYLGVGDILEVEAVFGYLPEVVTFPETSLVHLPNTEKEILADRDRRRKRLWQIKNHFPDRVPVCDVPGVVPFAVPIRGKKEKLEAISLALAKELKVEVPVLHFDFALNMLEPDYRPSLVIGCHSEWTEELVGTVCDFVSRELP